MKSQYSAKNEHLKVSTHRSRELGDGTRLFANADGKTIVALPSKQCFSLPSPSSIRKADLSLHYRLENEVPLDAESMSSALCVGKQVLVLLTDGAHLVQILESEKVRSDDVLAVLPLALLAVQPLINPLAPRQFFALALDGNIDLLSFRNGKLVEWRWVLPDREIVPQAVMSMTLGTEVAELGVIGDAEHELLEWLGEVALELKHLGEAETCIRTQAGKVLEGSELPLVNFRNGPLRVVDPLGPVKKLQAAAIVAAFMLFGIVAFALHWRAQQYHLRASSLIAQQEEVFREIFPGQAIPIGVTSRIESEHRRLSAAKGMAGAGVPDLGNILPVMQAFWEAAPTEIRYQIDSVHFTPKLIRKLDGKTRNYEDLDVFRESLISKGFKVPPISAFQSGKGVSLQLDQVVWEPLDAKANDE